MLTKVIANDSKTIQSTKYVCYTESYNYMYTHPNKEWGDIMFLSKSCSYNVTRDVSYCKYTLILIRSVKQSQLKKKRRTDCDN